MSPSAGSVARTGAGGALGALALASLASWVQNPGLYPQSALELVVFSLCALRLAAVFAVRSLRRMPSANAVVMFGTDVFVVLGSALCYEVTGDPLFSQFGREYSFAWFGAALVLYPWAATYFAVRGIGKGGRLSAELPACAAVFGFLALLIAEFSIGAETGGTSALASKFLLGLRGEGPVPSWNLLVVAAGGVLFASLLAAGGASSTSPGASKVPKLALMLAGPALVLSMSWLFYPASNSWVLFGAPVAIAGAAMVVASRGK